MTIDIFEQRKRDHITLALQTENEAIGGSGLERIQLVHEALPDLNFSEIRIQSQSFKQKIASPFFVSSMTAGHAQAVDINRHLLEACQHTGWAMGVGSQRRQLFDIHAHQEWQSIRNYAPDVNLFANLGIAQLIKTDVKQIEDLLSSIHATALFIHTNPLQECIQFEGTPDFKGSLPALAKLCADLSCPVILKETGCGFSENTLARLRGIGLAAVDVSGYGGTHWGRIEGQRGDNVQQHKTAQSFKHWGISTLASLVHAKSAAVDYEIWASGGIRSGLDAAKCLAMGANRVGLAKPMLQAATQGVEQVIQCMQTFEYELKVALFCTGSANIEQLREKARWQLTP